nr:hypothetical protein Iba_scaffold25407CG0010 [Ipomoea batatas]
MKNMHVSHAHESSFLKPTCQIATNVKTTHTFSNFLPEPPRGIYMYLTSHLLKDACQFFQKVSKL